MNENIEAFKKEMRGKKAVLLGLGISNVAAARFLHRMGMEIEARDKSNVGGEVIEKMNELDARVICGDEWLCDIDGDIVLRSPGIRPDVLKNVKMTSEMELFTSLCPCPIYAVTGSDGKTTTTTIVSKMLEAALPQGRRVWLGGNIGTPLLDRVDEIDRADVAVLELSSFQLMTMDISPRSAVMTNISPNHLNWHISMNEYVDAKRRIYMSQHVGDSLILNLDNEITRSFIGEARGDVFTFSSRGRADAYLDGDDIIIFGEKLLNVGEMKLRGRHNAENVMAACLAVFDIASIADMRAVATSFEGVAHRLQLIHEKNGVKFYNSSIDTSPTRTIAALSSFDEKVILIIGGYDKHLPTEPLTEPLTEKTKCIICTGDTGQRIHKMMTGSGYIGHIEYIKSFDDAVIAASRSARCGDTVLLSPAAASFDAFRNFEERGERFKTIIKNL